MQYTAENTNIYGNWKVWRRPKVSVTVGKPFYIREQPGPPRVNSRRHAPDHGSVGAYAAAERRGQYSYVSHPPNQITISREIKAD
ncbi:MAG: hypothetical protein U0X93_05815 [Anaerolineales bacterium]